MSENADAILDCWELGETGDMALAKILKGDVSPSGKLPVTIPRTIGQLPFHYSQKEINNTKDYLFSSKKPLYPFGFGLSFSKFSYSNIAISSTKMLPNKTITVSVDLLNTGNVVAKEVVQMYLKDEYATVMQPNRILKAFQKVELKPGETKTITFKITPEMLMHSGVDMKKIIEPGFFSVFIGGSSLADLNTRFEYATK
jgi:beta-glucosidase